MKLMKFWALALFIGLILSSCHKDKDESTLVDINIPGPEIVDIFYGDLQVYVTDLSGEPMKDVQVFVYNEVQVTNQWGLAEFTGIALDANGTYVRAIKENFFFGSDKFYPLSTNNFTAIRMLPIENGKKFDSGTAVSISVEGGGQIKFQENSVINTDGTLYNGEVTVYAYLLATDNPYIDQLMPGALLGLDDKNRTVVLGTYGMMAVEMRDENNNELNIDSNLPATIHMPIEESILANAPQEIPLWSFDENKGNWMQEGSAQLIDGEYVGEVTHFSFWNCDAPFPLINLSGNIVTENGAPVSNAIIKIKTGILSAVGYSNSDGIFGGKVPKDENLSIEIYTFGCSTPIYTANLGSFSDDVVLDEIVLPSNGYEISGQVLCSGVPFADAVIILQFPDITYEIESDSEGNFTTFISESLCEEAPDGIIFGIDPLTNESSPMITINSDSSTGIILDVCSNCDFDYTFNQSIIDPCIGTTEVILDVTNGSGDYTYSWSNGETSNTVSVLENQLLCVTITDNIADCDASYCEQITIADPLGVSIDWTDGNCDGEGYAEATVFSGTGPFSFLWTGPNGYTSTSQNIVMVDDGEYTVVVTDANNCEASSSTYVSIGSLVNLEIISNNNYVCEGYIHYLYVICDVCSLDPNNIIWQLPDGSTDFGEQILAIIPGTYSVFYDEGNCTSIADYTLEIIPEPTPQVTMLCNPVANEYEAEIFGLPPGYNVPSEVVSEEDLIEQFDIYYRDTIGVYSPEGCYFAFGYEIPNFLDGIVVTSVNEPTCDICEDGYVTIGENISNECIECEYDTYVIYKGDDYQTDYKIQNENNNLASGDYHVVAYSISGCVIFSVPFSL